MIIRNVKFFAAILFACSLYACMKCDPYTKQCKLTTDTYIAQMAGNVQYEVRDSGSVFVKSIGYHGPDGWVVVHQPTLPFTVTFPVTSSAKISIIAEGTAINGHFSIKSRFMAVGDTILKKDVCSN